MGSSFDENVTFETSEYRPRQNNKIQNNKGRNISYVKKISMILKSATEIVVMP